MWVSPSERGLCVIFTVIDEGKRCYMGILVVEEVSGADVG